MSFWIMLKDKYTKAIESDVDKYLSYAGITIVIFIFFFLALIIYQIDIFGFDDARNYYAVYQRIDPSNVTSLDEVYRERGIVYLFYPFRALGVSFSACLKTIYTFFSVLILIFSILFREKGRLSLLATLSIVAFVLTNRLYIEGAFNFVRSWIAIHLLMFSWFFLVGKSRRLSSVAGFVFIVIALLTHLQTTVIGSSLLVIITRGHLILGHHKMLVILSVIICVLLTKLMEILGIADLIALINHSAAENAKDAGGIKSSLAYQTLIPIFCLVISFFYNEYRNRGRQMLVIAICIQIAIVSVGAMWSVPVLLRFFDLSLVYCALMLPANGILKNTLEIFTFAGVAALNCLALYFSGVWNVL